MQRSRKRFVRGWENFLRGLAELFSLALPGSCLARFTNLLRALCMYLSKVTSFIVRMIMPNKQYKKSRLERQGQSWKNSSAINAVSPFTRQTSGPSLDVLGIFVSSMCPRIVQAADTMIYMHFWRVVVLGHFVDNLWISMNPENGQCLSSCSVTRWQMGKLWNPYFDSFLSTNISVHFGQQQWWKEDKGWL